MGEKLDCLIKWWEYAIGMFLVGIPCAVIGFILARVTHTPSLVSVPLCRTTENGPCDLYIGSPVQESCSISRLGKLRLNITRSSISRIGSTQDIWLAHNLKGYDFTLTVSVGGSSKKESYSFVRNMDTNGRITDVNKDDVHGMEILPSAFFSSGGVRISCPMATLVTNDLGIEPQCRPSEGHPVSLDDKLEWLRVGTVNYNDLGKRGNVTVEFEGLRAVPSDSSRTPQMFYVSWSLSRFRVLKTLGILIMVMGVITALGTLVNAMWGDYQYSLSRKRFLEHERRRNSQKKKAKREKQ